MGSVGMGYSTGLPSGKLRTTLLVCHVHIHSRGLDGINQLRGKSEKTPRFVQKVLPASGRQKRPYGRAGARHAAFI